MKTLATLIALSLILFAAAALAAEPAVPSIEGSYILDYRELPDGKQVRPPELVGMMTFTKDHRNFNIYWMQDGKPVSISLISRYTLSATEYAEQNLYYMDNNMPDGIKYDHEMASGKSPITLSGAEERRGTLLLLKHSKSPRSKCTVSTHQVFIPPD